MASYTYTKDDFGKKEIRPIKSEDLKEFKKNSFSQPLPNDTDEKVLSWAKGLIEESFNYTKGYHNKWDGNMLDYYTCASLDAAERAGRNPGVDESQDSDIMVPALIKRYVDLGALWLSREIFKVEPFMQYTNYEMDEHVRKIQKLYERKIQGDTETFGAREKATSIGIDLFLYGNAVMKAQFHQERVVCMEIPEVEINLSDEEDLFQTINLDDDEDPLAGIEVNIGSPYPVYSIVDQYAEFKPIFLGHFIIDPTPPGRDWRRSRFMGDVEFLSAEELMERFGEIKGFEKKLRMSSEKDVSISSMPLIGESSPFLDHWCTYYDQGRSVSSLKERERHSVVYLHTKYTETCIVDNSIVVYHRYRNKNIVKAGAFPYQIIKMPNPTGGLFSTGFGHTLETLQLEQIVLASKRLQTVEEMHKHIVTYIGGAVDKSKIQNIDNLTLIEMDQPGAIQEMVPNHQAMAGYLDAEARNFQRAEQYAGIPSILDSSNTKTHLGGISQRMEAAQVQFDVILDNARDAYKEIFQKMHVYNMAYLEGEIPIKGSTGAFNKEADDNILDASELAVLANQPELSLQLNLGMDIGAEKLQALAAVQNTQFMGMLMNQWISSGTLPPKQLQLLGMMFELGGITEFRPVFEPDPNAPMPSVPGMGQPGMQEGAPPMQGQPQIPPQG